jgi:hypothetical protein
MVNEIEFRNGGKCGRKIDVSCTNGKAESGKRESGDGRWGANCRVGSMQRVPFSFGDGQNCFVVGGN